ncbi:peptidase U32 [Afipia carboxidovorans OM5]|uniref:Ubiquinone biosynthesis protein UbiU n=1 Tax=Afipia carboxidovorans (strain ATCC 49405 / DSM 1227 / KCTC 32145 / OM5) TaxID=504832 RepID=B6JBV6_AFIC5|nr:peptidase U32 family protein [Afipia carboxidovorans]ACI92172.1 peptidase U32 [Afipia carboxidovorans OM5]AEI07613.1 peptidase U32 [Afipia carboxidovorans OM5]
MELICPAGTPAGLKAAVEAGADAVYCGFRDETNARNFPGLNFSPEELQTGIAYAHGHGVKVLVAINTFARAGTLDLWKRAVDTAVEAGADALIIADVGVLDYAARRHPDQRLHVSVQAAAANPDAIEFYVKAFGARRVVLPRVLSVAEIAAIAREVRCETEVFVFGGLCVMEEGRCSLSSYATGQSPNMNGVCSPASHVHYREQDGQLVSRLGAFTINKFAAEEPAGYPTLCKGRFQTEHGAGYLFEDPVSLDATTMLPELQKAGVTALKIEGRQRGRAYIERVVRNFRQTLAGLEDGHSAPAGDLVALTEGQSTTAGAYRKTWR